MTEKRKFQRTCKRGCIISLLLLLICGIWAYKVGNNPLPLTIWEYTLPIIGAIGAYILMVIFLIAGLGEYKPKDETPTPLSFTWFDNMNYKLTWKEKGYNVSIYSQHISQILAKIQELNLSHPEVTTVTITFRNQDNG